MSLSPPKSKTVKHPGCFSLRDTCGIPKESTKPQRGGNRGSHPKKPRGFHHYSICFYLQGFNTHSGCYNWASLRAVSRMRKQNLHCEKDLRLGDASRLLMPGRRDDRQALQKEKASTMGRMGLGTRAVQTDGGTAETP